MYSGESIIPLLDQLQRKQDYSDVTPQRPVFAFYSAVSSAYQAMVDLFGADMQVPMRSYIMGSNPAVGARAYPNQATEIRQSVLGWRYNPNNYYSSTYGFDPGSGLVGISCHSQTGCINNVDFSENSTWSFSGSNYAYLYACSGVVLGEPGYRQGMNLTKFNDRIGVAYLNNRNAVVGNTTTSLTWFDIAGLRRLVVGGNAYGQGDVAYNRVTNTLAFIERRADSSYLYRMHIFKNLPKLKVDPFQIKAALNAAGISGSTANYETFDFTWSGGDTSEWQDGTRIILCDDGSIWMARMNPSIGFFLATITAPAANGTRTFATIGNTSTAATTYGREQGNPYGARHMVSDNGEVVAVYCPYYYYHAGANFYFLSRRSISAMRIEYVYSSTTSGASIAPAGGSNFVMDQNSNNDGVTNRAWLINLEPHVAAANKGSIGLAYGYLNVTGLGGGTSIGGNGVIKVQPAIYNTTEFKERDL